MRHALEKRTTDSPATDAARQLNRAAATLALSVLADSAVEHYRGSFHNKAMYLPLCSAALSAAANAWRSTDRRSGATLAPQVSASLATGIGLMGLGFHIYNIGKREGGFSWLNLFYAAPVGAPAALSLSGLLALAAERLRSDPGGGIPRLLGLKAGRALAAATSAGLAGTVGEVGLLHFRGAFQNPFMVLPLTAPPVAAALMADAAVRGRAPSSGVRRMTKGWLRATALLGFAGSAFHIYGVGRGMGGWRNWSQNVLNGPPIPAPPSFTGLAIAGLAALSLLEAQFNE